MDVRFINPFMKSISNTFETMCAATVSTGKPTLANDGENNADVSAIIGFSGDAAGSVVLRFRFDVASKIATAFAQTDITPEHEDFADALGELANMVAGGAKAKFDGLAVDISLPSVVVGEHHHFPVSKNAPRITIPCMTNYGTFQVEVGMVLAKKPSLAARTPLAGAQA